MGNHVKEAVVDAVVMTFGIRTLLGITLRLFHKAYLLLGGKGDVLKFESRILKSRHSLLGYCPGYGPCSQIKEPAAPPFSHTLKGRKKDRECLARSRRSFDKKLSPVIYRIIYILDKLPLSGSVFKGKFKLCDGILPFNHPLGLHIQPFVHGLKSIVKPPGDLFSGITGVEVSDLFRMLMHIGHAHIYFREFFGHQIYGSIHFCLSQMHRIRNLHAIDAADRGFDLIYCDILVCIPRQNYAKRCDRVDLISAFLRLRICFTFIIHRQIHLHIRDLIRFHFRRRIFDNKAVRPSFYSHAAQS